ncbi:hypothetical protein C8J56DRAFT_152272 [Mycena floridula]|nr:hypothetical protein C8J56DRAFT_152272 [Mycena floridula]
MSNPCSTQVNPSLKEVTVGLLGEPTIPVEEHRSAPPSTAEPVPNADGVVNFDQDDAEHRSAPPTKLGSQDEQADSPPPKPNGQAMATIFRDAEIGVFSSNLIRVVYHISLGDVGGDFLCHNSNVNVQIDGKGFLAASVDVVWPSSNHISFRFPTP